MPDAAPGPVQDRWCDVDGAHIPLFSPLFSRVEQVAEYPEHRVLLSRLHQCGDVPGRGPDVLYVRFEGEGLLLGVAPSLVRLLPEGPGGG
jgi:hypothetical protein